MFIICIMCEYGQYVCVWVLVRYRCKCVCACACTCVSGLNNKQRIIFSILERWGNKQNGESDTIVFYFIFIFILVFLRLGFSV